LTQTELDILQQIKQDVSGHVDLILEHGYTGVINNANIDSIVAAVVVSMLSTRAIILKEFLKGMELFGLAATLKKYPKSSQKLVCHR
jgi:argininosuccinate synthase